jgi:hypothetical protein
MIERGSRSQDRTATKCERRNRLIQAELVAPCANKLLLSDVFGIIPMHEIEKK